MTTPTTVAEAVAAVAHGRLVVLPTDTVYGVGADAFSPAAVNALLAAKGRGRDMPVPVLIGAPHTLEGIADGVSDAARRLIDAFWPGALSLVVRHPPSLQWDLGDSAGTVVVRMPMHPVALELLTVTGPMAVSSANRSGSPPATTVTEARVQLGAAVAVYLDGGATPGPVPSTIVDVSTPDAPPRVLRLGAIGSDDLRAVVPDLVG
ncbi:MAG TPA: L-threonylcarbamoyladenylate synthase [Mycobacteriales bacterium]|jgi:tRNA threonylcarbamoyl adenosine modification protein (Sua5/YciO/YrdC/YwlC family)|nr:L-threonylcarbamoyladenylate synthase [Mycobacteriales bacterium]